MYSTEIFFVPTAINVQAFYPISFCNFISIMFHCDHAIPSNSQQSVLLQTHLYCQLVLRMKLTCPESTNEKTYALFIEAVSPHWLIELNEIN